MCNKRNSRRIKINGRIIRVDSCMADQIIKLNNNGVTTLACCCGHGIYPMTIIVPSAYPPLNSFGYDMKNRKVIPRTRRFYFRDKAGFYYIPETVGDPNAK